LKQYANSNFIGDFMVNDTMSNIKKSIEGKSDEEAMNTIGQFIDKFATGAFNADSKTEATPATKRYIRQDATVPENDGSVLGVPISQFIGDFVGKIQSNDTKPIETPKDYDKNYTSYDSDWYDKTDRQKEVVTDGNVWRNRLDVRDYFNEGLAKSKELQEASRKKNSLAYDPVGAIKGVFDNIMPKAEASEAPKKESGLVNTVRDAMGIIDYFAPDGTNCTRTMGVVLQGTPYEGLINIDQFEERAEILGMKRNPDTYKPKAGDIAVVNDGGHMIMVTENGGFINNGFSRGGIWESDQSYDEYAGKGHIDYYITTSQYDKLYDGNTEKGAKELGINRDKGAIYNQLYEAAERSYNYERPTGKFFAWGGKV
jgi:hypothetical protein